MTFIVRLLCIILLVRDIRANIKENKLPHDTFKTKIPLTPNNDMIGVSSVAGVASRNGRVSSMGSVQFFSPFDHKIFKTENLEPSILKKESDDKMLKNAENLIRRDSNVNMDSFMTIYPGSVTVSASSKTGRVGNNKNPWFNRFDPTVWPINIGSLAVSSSTKGDNIGSNVNTWTNRLGPMIWSINNPYTGPMNVLDYQRNLELIHRDIFNNFVPPDMYYMRRNWMFPTFNPFLNY